MNYDIQLGKYKIAHLLSCEVRKSANRLCDTATIRLIGMAYNKALEVENQIKRGDEVSIQLGYNYELKQEFKGYITSIATDNTIVIECEDGMFLMRTAVKNKQYKNVEAATIIEDVVTQIGGFTVVKGEGISIAKYDKFTINDATAYDVLKKIQEKMKLHIFVKGSELHVHLSSTYKEGNVSYDYSKNVEASSLKYLKEEDKKVEVQVVGITRKNEKTTVSVGEKGGDFFKQNEYNVTDEEALRSIGLEILKQKRYTGYEGDITTWLVPYVTYGYSAKILDIDYPARQGTYYVDAVTTKFDQSGGKRKVTLGILLS